MRQLPTPPAATGEPFGAIPLEAPQPQDRVIPPSHLIRRSGVLTATTPRLAPATERVDARDDRSSGEADGDGTAPERSPTAPAGSAAPPLRSGAGSDGNRRDARETPPAAGSPVAIPGNDATREETGPDGATRPAPVGFASAPGPVAVRTARAGETLDIVLPGDGWLFVGADGPIELRSRAAGPEGTRFTFRVASAAVDSLELRFERQDVTSGTHERRVARVDVVPASHDATATSIVERESDAVAGQAGPGSATEGATTQGATIRQAPLSERVADALTGNAAFDSALAQDLVDAIRTGSATDVTTADVVQLARIAVDDGSAADAIALIDALALESLPNADEALLVLATALEATGPARDLRRARAAYQRIVDRYPLSAYWETARQRVEYLDRHYFLIR